MWVIKLGGSLLGSIELRHWLDLVARLSDGKVIIVPGGGVFADAVRTAYGMTAMSETCAHDLAVNAMNQYGTLLMDMEPNLVQAHSELEIAERGWQHRGVIWMPSQMLQRHNEEIMHSWDVTADSLAAWLAKKIGAAHLVLVKSTLPVAEATMPELIEQGLIDTAFPHFFKDAAFTCHIVDKADYAVFANGFTESALTQVGLAVKA